MRLVLSDTALPAGLPVREDWHYVDLSQLKIADCMGCFSCWVRTPGRCVIRDDAVGVYPLIAHSDHVIYVSRLFCGSYDVPMKTMLERAIPIQQAFIRIHHGETHHIQRAVAEKDAVILAYGDTGDEEQALFRLLAARNAHNMLFRSWVSASFGKRSWPGPLGRRYAHGKAPDRQWESPGAPFQLPEVYRTVSSVLGRDGGPVYRAEGWTALPRGLYGSAAGVPPVRRRHTGGADEDPEGTRSMEGNGPPQDPRTGELRLSGAGADPACGRNGALFSANDMDFPGGWRCRSARERRS